MPTCSITETKKRPCISLKLEEEKWKRRVTALETAIAIYQEKKKAGQGGLVQAQDTWIGPGSCGCTTKYRPVAYHL